MVTSYSNLIKKVKDAYGGNKLDLSKDEDLSIGIMNLISIEEHLFFTLQKTKKALYLDLLNEVRLLRTRLLKEIIKEYEGEVWCISKHLLASSMRLMEVGTKELKKRNKQKAQSYFNDSYKLYILFWKLNLEKNEGASSLSESKFSKFESFIKKAIDCCKE